jgi:LCP family protein required for cell wall assembly
MSHSTPAVDPSVEPTRRPRHSRALVTLAVLAALLIGALVVTATVAGAWVVGVARSFDDATSTLANPFPADAGRPAASTDGAMNVLVLGSDSRVDDAPVGSDPTDQRSDTMMLVHVDADREGVHVVSIMRDSSVTIPGHGQGKINAAYAEGGSALAVETVEDLLHVRVDHVAVIDFEGFKGMTTALGGVQVSVPQAFTSKKYGYTYASGPQRMEGDAALSFVRERYAFDDADYSRVRNQQAFVRGLVGTLLSRDTLTDPGKLADFASALAPYLSVDDGLDAGTVAALGVSLRTVTPSQFHFSSLPTDGTAIVDGQSVVVLDQAGLDDVRQGLAGDTLDLVTAAP